MKKKGESKRSGQQILHVERERLLSSRDLLLLLLPSTHWYM